MAATILALLEVVFRIVSNHNETFLIDEVESNVGVVEEA